MKSIFLLVSFIALTLFSQPNIPYHHYKPDNFDSFAILSNSDSLPQQNFHFKTQNDLKRSRKIKGTVFFPLEISCYDPYNYDYKIIYIYDNSWNIQTYRRVVWENNTWLNSTQYTYTYDQNGNVLTKLDEKWVNYNWANSSKTSWTYDQNGNMLTKLDEKWGYTLGNYSWTNYSKTSWTYDQNGNMLNRLDMGWQNNAWININMCSYSYTFGNNGTAILVDYYEWENTSWVFTLRFAYNYDINGNILSKLVKHWENNGWLDSYRETFSYDVNGNTLIKLVESWSSYFATWLNSVRINYTYDNNGNMLMEFHEEWGDNTWLNSVRINYTYDNNGSLLIRLWEQWANNSWSNPLRQIFTYDNNGNAVLGEQFVWQNGSWVVGSNGTIRIYYNNMQSYMDLSCNKVSIQYTFISDVNDKNTIPERYLLSQNYPNPFNPSTVITYQIPNSDYVSVKVYDILGTEVKTLVNQEQSAGNYKVEFDAGNLSSGVYFYELRAGKFREVKKLILTK